MQDDSLDFFRIEDVPRNESGYFNVSKLAREKNVCVCQWLNSAHSVFVIKVLSVKFENEEPYTVCERKKERDYFLHPLLAFYFFDWLKPWYTYKYILQLECLQLPVINDLDDENDCSCCEG